MQTKEGPDELTPREREVFGLLRLGLTNEEIAERLGISLDGAKYHVSQILSKLGVGSREEAAAVPVEARRRWWVMLPLAAKAAGAAVVLAAVGSLGVLAWGVLNTSDGTEAGDSAPSAVLGPRIGDHWHAPIFISVCTERQHDVSVPENGIRTQGDNIIHIEPAQPFEEGLGASLIKWFEYGGGLLTDTEIRVPGSDETFGNGDLCEGDPGGLEVYVAHPGTGAQEWERLQGDALAQYIPQDGDRISIAFRSEDEPLVYPDRTIIPPEEATREIDLAVMDDGTESGVRFEPNRIEIPAGETVKISVRNAGTMSHVIRVSGDDTSFASSDDFVSVPDIILPGDEGYVVIRLQNAGEVEFRDDALAGVVTGVIVVK